MFNRYRKDERGHFALFTAILAVPLMICVGIAIDTNSLNRNTTHLQSALDSAALASVVPGNMGIIEREEYAKTVFRKNYPHFEDVKLDVKADHNRVDMKGVLEQQMMLMGLTGLNSVKTVKMSAAVRNEGDPVCVMALNEKAEGALTFDKKAQIEAPACAIQVNSSHRKALISSGSYEPKAKKICVNGGVSGSVGIEVQANCTRLADPYADLVAPEIVSNASCDHGPLMAFKFTGFRVQDKLPQVMQPGVYCGGMHIYESKVTLEPGVYIMRNGPLTIGHNAEVVGKDVTFIFMGRVSGLYTYENFKLDLSAPTTGPYAGVIFFQDPESSVGETSIIKGGADIRLNGAAYFPTQHLFVGGEGVMGSNAPSMSFVADKLTFSSDIEEAVSRSETHLKSFIRTIESFAIFSGQLGTTEFRESQSIKDENLDGFKTVIVTHAAQYNGEDVSSGTENSDGGARLVRPDASKFNKVPV